MKKRWSLKYKRNIDCSSPKGFSQKNYCKRQKRGGNYKNFSFKEWLKKEETDVFGSHTDYKKDQIVSSLVNNNFTIENIQEHKLRMDKNKCVFELSEEEFNEYKNDMWYNKEFYRVIELEREMLDLYYRYLKIQGDNVFDHILEDKSKFIGTAAGKRLIKLLNHQKEEDEIIKKINDEKKRLQATEHTPEPQKKRASWFFINPKETNEWLKNEAKLNKKNVPVYNKDGKIIDYVYASTTSIGAAKATKTPSAEFTGRFGKHGWVGVDKKS